MSPQRVSAFTCMVLVAVCFSTWAFDQKPKPKPKAAEPIPFCLDEPDFLTVKNAFDMAAKAQKLADGCIPGQRVVKLDEKTAYNLLFAIAQGLNLPNHEPHNTKPKDSRGQ